jgi:integrase
MLVKGVARKAKLDPAKFWPHKFRATFCTWYADAGVPIPTIQLGAGHKDMATTMRYIRPNRSPEVKAKFNATFAGI